MILLTLACSSSQALSYSEYSGTVAQAVCSVKDVSSVDETGWLVWRDSCVHTRVSSGTFRESSLS